MDFAKKVVIQSSITQYIFKIYFKKKYLKIKWITRLRMERTIIEKPVKETRLTIVSASKETY